MLESIGLFLTVCRGIDLKYTLNDLRHPPRIFPSVDPSTRTLGQKILYPLTSIKFCYHLQYMRPIPASCNVHHDLDRRCISHQFYRQKEIYQHVDFYSPHILLYSALTALLIAIGSHTVSYQQPVNTEACLPAHEYAWRLRVRCVIQK